MNKIYQAMARKPLLVLTGLLVLSAVFVMGMGKNARIETDLDKYMPSDHPAFVFSDEAEEQFGIRDSILLAVEHPDTIFNTETLEKIKLISEALPDRFEEIKDGDVTSLYTAENITADEWGLTVEAFYKKAPRTAEGIDKVRKAVQANEMINGRIVSLDGKATLIVAEIADEAFTDSFYEELQVFATEWEGPETIHIAGRPVVEGELTRLGPKDMARMAPMVIILMLGILLLLLRNVRNTLINLIIVLFGTLAAFGAMALANVPVYQVSTMIPVMLIAIGVAYGIHMHNTIEHLVREEPGIGREELVGKTLKAMVRPVSMAAITTAVGFLSLITSEVLPVRYFGFFTALGVMTEMLAALILFPGSIYLLGPPRVPAKYRPGKENPTANEGSEAASQLTRETKKPALSERFGSRLLARPGISLITALLVVAVALFGTSRVWIDTSFLANFQEDSPVVVTDTFVNTHFGGTSTLNVIFSSDENDTFKDPEILEKINSLQEAVEENPRVGDSFGLTDYMRRMHKVMHEDNQAYDKIPESRDMIAQYLLLYEMSGDPDNLNQVVDYDYKTANLTFQLKSDSSALMDEIIRVIEPRTAAFAEQGVRVEFAGSGYKSLVFANLLLEGQILSLLISFGIVALLLTLMFRNLWIGLAGSIPITITAIVNFGTMGLLGIPLSSSTAIISSIAIGIGVDYAIHLIERYRTKRLEGLDIREAAIDTLSHTGRAIIYNAVAVMGGFAVLLISVFPPNRQVGGLIALNMASSAIGTLTVLLVVLIFIDRRGGLIRPQASRDKAKLKDPVS
jgi:hypothetical protein